MPGRERPQPQLVQAGGPASERDSLTQIILVLSLGAVYVVTSAGLIAFNKYLINPNRFPYAVCLVLCHAGFSSAMACVLFVVKPSFFPSLTDPIKKVSIDKKLLLGGAVPIAILFSVQLVLSNTAYLHSSTAFLQMMKESNLVLVFGFSLLAALEHFSWAKARLIFLIMFATMLTIEGEIKFSFVGFAMQGTSQLFESAKIVLQAMLLSSAGSKLDPLSYVLLVMPFCFLVLGLAISCIFFVHPISFFQMPQWSDIVTWWPVLLANAVVAFALNLVVAVFMKHSSGVGFILAGITKDAAIVLAGASFLGELISGLQIFAFVLQLVLIWTWSLMKVFPDTFEGGVLRGFWELCGFDGQNKKSAV